MHARYIAACTFSLFYLFYSPLNFHVACCFACRRFPLRFPIITELLWSKQYCRRVLTNNKYDPQWNNEIAVIHSKVSKFVTVCLAQCCKRQMTLFKITFTQTWFPLHLLQSLASCKHGHHLASPHSNHPTYTLRYSFAGVPPGENN